MGQTALETASMDFRKARGVNGTDTSFDSVVPTVTEPTGDAGDASGAAVIDLRGKGHTVQNSVLVVPYGEGADATTFDVRVIGWKRVPGNKTTQRDLWVPVPLAKLSVALSTPTGVAASPILATEVFADTITLAAGFNDDVDISITSPADDTIAHFLLDMKGFDKLQLVFDMTGATSGNALVAFL